MRASGGGPAWTPNGIVSSNNQIAVQFVATGFGYMETQGGQKLDSEGNWVPGVGVEVSLMKNWLTSNFYFDAQYSYLRGNTDYVGQGLGAAEGGGGGGGGYGSLKGPDGAIVNDLDLRLGKGFEIRPNFMVTPYFGVGYHDWDRKVNAGEEYSNGYAGGGLLLQWSPVSRLVLSAHGLVGATFGSYIDVSGSSGFSGALGDSAIYRGGLSGDYALTRSIHVNAGVEWVGFNYGESAIYQVGDYSVWEPNSRTNNTTVKVGVGYAFGSGFEPLK